MLIRERKIPIGGDYLQSDGVFRNRDVFQFHNDNHFCGVCVAS